MTPVTMTEFEDLIMKDEALLAKAKAISGDDPEKAEKIIALAESLGYELLVEYPPKELADSELDDVAGGGRKGTFGDNPKDCRHKYVYIKEVPGRVFGINSVYQCKNCGRYFEKIGPIYIAYIPR